MKNKEERLLVRQELYNQGYTDLEIATIQNVSKATIKDWRKSRGLRFNPLDAREA